MQLQSSEEIQLLYDENLYLSGYSLENQIKYPQYHDTSITTNLMNGALSCCPYGA